MEPSIVEFIKTGDAESLKQALSENPKLANGKTEQGISFLMFAAYYRNATAVQLIRDKKSNIDVYESAAIGDLENVKKHIGNKADLVNSFSSDGFTPLGLACFFGHLEIVKYLIGNGADVNLSSTNSFHVYPIHSAAAISNYEIVSLLLEHGANPNVQQQLGATPLHSSAHNGQTKLTKLLIDHGADVNARMEDGKTPLAMAEEKSYGETAELIKSYGGN